MYSPTVIKTAIRAYFTFGTYRKAARHVGVPKSTIFDWVSRLGRLCRSPPQRKRCHRSGRRRSKWEDIPKAVQELLANQPFQTQRELKHAIEKKTCRAVPLSTLQRLVKMAIVASWRTPTRDTTSEQNIFRALIASYIRDGRNIIAIDETSRATASPFEGTG